MYLYKRFVAIACILLLALSSCNNLPDHAKYIPKDAVMVMGVDFKALTKKVAWNVITGSKLFSEMQKKLQGKVDDKAVENAGIDLMNTIYVYAKTDVKSGRVAALIPLSDASKWENFMKGSFPASQIKEQGKIKMAMMGDGTCAGWNDKLLIVMKLKGNDDYGSMQQGSDETALLAELQSAFDVSSDNSLVKNSKYVTLEKEGHDIIFWINYQQLMDQYKNNPGAAEWMGNLSAMNNFWKDAAVTIGCDFEKGKLASEMHYYLSDDMHNLGKEMGSTNASDEMLNKLPAQNLDGMFDIHLSTKGTRDLLEKMGVLGFANVALGQKNMDMDYVLDAFTGDMAFSLNNLTFKKQMHQGDSMLGIPSYETTSPSMDYVFVMKIKKKQNIDKILGLLEGAIQPVGNNTYTLSSFGDSATLMYNDNYLVVSKNSGGANAYMQNSGNQKLPVAGIYGHPTGLFVDFQQVFSGLSSSTKGSGQDSIMLVETQKTFQNLTMGGAEFKNNSFEYHMDLNFVNKDENSLIQVMDYIMRMKEAKETTPTYSYNQ